MERLSKGKNYVAWDAQKLTVQIEELFDAMAEEIENVYGRETDLTIKARDFLAKHDVLKEQGMLLGVPCKLGDIVYDVVLCNDNEYRIFKMKVCNINPFGQIRNDKVWNVYLETVGESSKAYRSFYDFGRTVFLTEEDAEATLERMQNNREE